MVAGDAATVNVLVAARADPGDADSSGTTAVEWARDMAYDDVLDMLRGGGSAAPVTAVASVSE